MIDSDLLARALAYVKKSMTDPLPEPKQIPIEVVSSGARKVCDEAVNLIISFEGLAKVKSDGLVYPYHDVVGYPTIGYGRLLSRVKWEDLSKYNPITKEEAKKLKLVDLDRFSIAVSKMLKVEVSDNQFGALVSLCFNIGPGNLQGSTLIRKLNRGDSTEEIGAEFLKWNKAGGKIWAGLTRRRKAERDLFLC